jgi:pimeloyl-ACP methyl ester carboxylesterase
MTTPSPGCGTITCRHATPRRPEKAAKDAVVLLHGSAGTSALWRGLKERLAPVYDVITPDLIGYGQAEPWLEQRQLLLEDEAAPLPPRTE